MCDLQFRYCDLRCNVSSVGCSTAVNSERSLEQLCISKKKKVSTICASGCCCGIGRVEIRLVALVSSAVGGKGVVLLTSRSFV